MGFDIRERVAKNMELRREAPQTFEEFKDRLKKDRFFWQAMSEYRMQDFVAFQEYEKAKDEAWLPQAYEEFKKHMADVMSKREMLEHMKLGSPYERSVKKKRWFLMLGVGFPSLLAIGVFIYLFSGLKFF